MLCNINGVYSQYRIVVLIPPNDVSFMDLLDIKIQEQKKSFQ